MSTSTGKFFYVGKRYRARQDFTVGATFRKDELLVFIGGGFVPYDNAHSYEFRSLTDGSSKAWLLREDDPLSLREELFERMPDE